MDRRLTFTQAIREALDLCMASDSNVILIGEGVPDPKAIFNSTSGLREKYGESRVFDMPLSENGASGFCIGASMLGIKPIMVHQRIDFALLAMDQLINNASKWHYMFDGKKSIPLVVRMIVGRGWGQGPQHSQSLQSIFSHFPGLKVVMPTTAYDAKGMLISAVEDENPVMFIEHRWLHNISDHVPEDYYRVPLDQARVIHEGDLVTVASFSYMTLEALKAAKILKNELNVSLEIIDMRSTRPLDIQTVVKSLRRTRKLIVCDTGFKTGGIASELITQVVETSFRYLDRAPVRICNPDYPTPTSFYQSSGYYPGAKDIVSTALEMLGISIQGSEASEQIMAKLTNEKPHDVPALSFSGPF